MFTGTGGNPVPVLFCRFVGAVMKRKGRAVVGCFGGSAKYPRLSVLSCSGIEEDEESAVLSETTS